MTRITQRRLHVFLWLHTGVLIQKHPSLRRLTAAPFIYLSRWPHIRFEQEAWYNRVIICNNKAIKLSQDESRQVRSVKMVCGGAADDRSARRDWRQCQPQMTSPFCIGNFVCLFISLRPPFSYWSASCQTFSLNFFLIFFSGIGWVTTPWLFIDCWYVALLLHNCLQTWEGSPGDPRPQLTQKISCHTFDCYHILNFFSDHNWASSTLVPRCVLLHYVWNGNLARSHHASGLLLGTRRWGLFGKKVQKYRRPDTVWWGYVWHKRSPDPKFCFGLRERGCVVCIWFKHRWIKPTAQQTGMCYLKPAKCIKSAPDEHYLTWHREPSVSAHDGCKSVARNTILRLCTYVALIVISGHQRSRKKPSRYLWFNLHKINKHWSCLGYNSTLRCIRTTTRNDVHRASSACTQNKPNTQREIITQNRPRPILPARFWWPRKCTQASLRSS